MSCAAYGQPMGFSGAGDHLTNSATCLGTVVVSMITIIDGTSPVFLGHLGALGMQKWVLLG